MFIYGTMTHLLNFRYLSIYNSYEKHSGTAEEHSMTYDKHKIRFLLGNSPNCLDIDVVM
jgi:hypothetical protein